MRTPSVGDGASSKGSSADSSTFGSFMIHTTPVACSDGELVRAQNFAFCVLQTLAKGDVWMCMGSNLSNLSIHTCVHPICRESATGDAKGDTLW